MKSSFFNLCLILLIPVSLYAQPGKNKFRIFISDNHNIQNEAYYYTITNDSLVITGLSDYGKSNIDYLKRVLTESESISMADFMMKFPVDKFYPLYFKDYANLGYISPEHFPRVIELELMNLGKSKKIKVNNSYVTQFAKLFEAINSLLPDEVKIKYEAKDLGK